jgi:hypothetical protein
MDYAYLDPTPRSERLPRMPQSLWICRQHIRSVPYVHAVVLAGLSVELLRVIETLQV